MNKLELLATINGKEPSFHLRKNDKDILSPDHLSHASNTNYISLLTIQSSNGALPTLEGFFKSDLQNKTALPNLFLDNIFYSTEFKDELGLHKTNFYSGFIPEITSMKIIGEYSLTKDKTLTLKRVHLVDEDFKNQPDPNSKTIHLAEIINVDHKKAYEWRLLENREGRLISTESYDGHHIINKALSIPDDPDKDIKLSKAYLDLYKPISSFLITHDFAKATLPPVWIKKGKNSSNDFSNYILGDKEKEYSEREKNKEGFTFIDKEETLMSVDKLHILLQPYEREAQGSIGQDLSLYISGIKKHNHKLNRALYRLLSKVQKINNKIKNSEEEPGRQYHLLQNEMLQVKSAYDELRIKPQLSQAYTQFLEPKNPIYSYRILHSLEKKDASTGEKQAEYDPDALFNDQIAEANQAAKKN